MVTYKDSPSGLLLGSWNGSEWKDWKSTHDQMKGGEKYTAYGPEKSEGEFEGKKPELSQASGDAYQIELNKTTGANHDLLLMTGVTSNPILRPREETGERKHEAKEAVERALKKLGITKADIDLKKIWTVDLDGTGASEILIEAASKGLDVSMLAEEKGRKPKAGDFSMVLLVQINPDGKNVETVLGGEFLPRVQPELAAVYNRFELLTVIDLNGDGIEEVLLTSSYYEGAGAMVWTLKDGKPVKVLEAADGA